MTNVAVNMRAVFVAVSEDKAGRSRPWLHPSLSTIRRVQPASTCSLVVGMQSGSTYQVVCLPVCQPIHLVTSSHLKQELIHY